MIKKTSFMMIKTLTSLRCRFRWTVRTASTTSDICCDVGLKGPLFCIFLFDGRGDGESRGESEFLLTKNRNSIKRFFILSIMDFDNELHFIDSSDERVDKGGYWFCDVRCDIPIAGWGGYCRCGEIGNCSCIIFPLFSSL